MPHRIYFFLFIILAGSISLQAQRSSYLFFERVTVALTESPASFGEKVKDGEIRLKSFEGQFTLIAHFESIPDSNERKQLAASGVQLHGYVPNNSWWITVPAEYDLAQLEQWHIDYIYQPVVSDKLSRQLQSEELPDHTIDQGEVRLWVHTWVATGPGAVKTALEKISSVPPARQSGYPGVYEVRVERDDMDKLASQPFIYYVSAIDPPPEPEVITYRSAARSNWLSENPALGQSFTGNDVTLGIRESKVDEDNIELKGRLDNSNHPGPYSAHANMVSEVMAGAGNYDPFDIGMAHGAGILSASYGFSLSSLHSQGASVVNNSFGWGCNVYPYNFNAANHDQLIHDNEDFMVVYSSGNEGNNDCGYGAGAPWGSISGSPKIGKNVIAMGATNIYDELMGFSSCGPAYDGRIKPDLVAVGPSGTSFSAPGATGIYGQLIEYYKSANGGQHPNTSLLKAVLQNTADDLGNSGPDFKFGYGRINVRRAYNVLDNGQWLKDSIGHNQSHQQALVVPEGTKKLKIMLYWADQEATPGVSKALVNDLDFGVDAPDGTTYLPWVLDHTPNPALLDAPAQRKVDTLNNMEQVTIDDPEDGSYTLTVDGTNVPVGPQPYFIVYEFVPDEVQLTYPVGGEAFVPEETEVIRWDNYGDAAPFDLHYTIDYGSSWNTITTGIDPGQRYYEWTVPNEATGRVQVRIDRASESSVSDTFSIIPVPQNLDVLWACGDSLMLYWDSLPEAQEYELSMLGQKYMDSIGRTDKQYFMVDGVNNAAEQWFSIRALGQQSASGRRAIAINKAAGTTNCILQDAAIFQVTSPKAGQYPDCVFPGPVPVKVRLMNMGVNTLNDVPVRYRVKGGSVHADTLWGSLPSAEKRTLVFSDSIMLPAGTHEIEIWTAHSGDGNSANDTMAITLEVVNSGEVSLNYSQDFDNFSLCSTDWGCESITCSLSENWMNQPNETVDDIDWRTDNNGTVSANTGPSQDHTTGSGNYVYLESSGNGGSGCWNKEAHLTSPCVDLSNTSDPEISFWYHARGNSVGSLHLDAFVDGQWMEDIMIPVIGDQGEEWIEAVVPLDSFVDENLAFRFRGITGQGFQSDIALDDIQISTLPTAGYAQSMQYVCPGQVVTFSDQTHYADSVKWIVEPGNVSYLGNTHSNSWSPMLMVNGGGNYTVQQVVYNSRGTDTSESQIFAGPHEVELFTNDSSSQACSGDTVHFTAYSNGYYYDYFVNGTLMQSDSSTTFSYPIDQDATVSVRATINSQGCLSQVEAKYIEVSHLTGSVLETADVSCHGHTDGFVEVEGSDGIGNYEYTWHDGMGGRERDSITAGIYHYTITDEAGCTYVDSADVGSPAPLVANGTVEPVTCPGGNDGAASVQPAGGTGPYDISWSTGSVGNTISNLAAGDFGFTITDSNNCTLTDTVPVTQPNALAGNFQVEPVGCAGGSDGSISVAATGGTGPYQYEWASGSTDTLRQDLPAGNYQLIITDSEGCTSADTVEVNEPAPLNIGAVALAPYACEEVKGHIETEASGGSGSLSYNWSTGDTGQALTGLEPGSYGFTVTDENGCTADTTFSIDQAPAIGLSQVSRQQPTCAGVADGSIAVEGSGGLGQLQFDWNTGATDAVIHDLAAGSYQLTITDSIGCELDTVLVLEEPEPLDYELLAFTDTICPHSEEGIIEVSGTGGTQPYAYAWQGGHADSLFSDLAQGTYELTITDANACTREDTFVIDAYPQASVDIFPETDTASCDPVEFLAGGNFEVYTWPDAETGSSYEATATGNIYVTATDSNGCDTNSDTIAYERFPTPQDYDISGPDTVIVDQEARFFTEKDTGSICDWQVDGGELLTDQDSDTIDAVWQDPGTYTVWLQQTSNRGCTGASVGKEVVVVLPGGIGAGFGGELKVYPNPNEGRVTVDITTNYSQKIFIEVYNQLGQVVHQIAAGTAASSIRKTLDLRSLAKGWYVVSVKGDKGSARRLILIQ